MRGQRDKVTFSPRGVAASFIIVMAALLFSCGLPTREYLYPPTQFYSASGIIRLYHDSNNIDDAASAALFKGYDIYYRIFDTKEAADTSYSTLSSSLTYSNISTIVSSQKYYVLSKRSSSGDTYDIRTPLIPFGTSDSYTYFALNINNLATWTITADDSATHLFYIVRNRGTTTLASTADFCLYAHYNSGDQDYAGDGISSGDSVYIVFFAVAHGVSSSSIGTDIYSDPVILEPIAYAPGS